MEDDHFTMAVNFTTWADVQKHRDENKKDEETQCAHKIANCLGPCLDKIKPDCSGSGIKNFFLGKLPFINIFRTYNVKKCLLLDLLAGLTLGIVHIPQGMGFSMLANLPPVYGLYASFFPVICYFFLTTTRHNSFGSMSLIAMMIGAVVERELHLFEAANPLFGAHGNDTEDALLAAEKTITYAPNADDTSNIAVGVAEMVTGFAHINGTTLSPFDMIPEFSPEEVSFKVGVAMLVSLTVGILQVFMGVVKLGVLATYFSRAFISGINFGAAFQITFSQIRFLLGLQIPGFTGPASLIYTAIAILKNITKVNVADLLISVICILVMVLVKKFINQKFIHKIKVPIPIELIVVILSIVITKYCYLTERFGVAVIGKIPQGMPTPQIPPVHKMKTAYIMDAVPIAVVGFVCSVLFGKLFAAKYEYKIDSDQELFANGISNIIGSFFSCFACSTAPPRTILNDSVGGKTQLVSLFSSVVVLMVLLVLGPLFQALPVACLASIIVVALIPMFQQGTELPKLWKCCKPDAAVWIATAFVTLFIDLKFGIIIGLISNLIVVFVCSQKAKLAMLSKLRDSESYVDSGLLPDDVDMVEGVRIFKFEAPLMYANAEMFVMQLMAIVQKAAAAAAKAAAEQNNDTPQENGAVDKNGDVPAETKPLVKAPPKIHTFILDCSCMFYLDTVGADIIKKVAMKLKLLGVTMCLANCTKDNVTLLEKMGHLADLGSENIFFSVSDAVAAAKMRAKATKDRESIV